MMIRYVASALFGLTMTFNLLYVMHALIDTGNAVMTNPQTIDLPRWIAEPPEEAPPPIDEPPVPIDPPLSPPPYTPTEGFDEGGPGVFVPIPPQAPIGDPSPPTLHAFGDGPLMSVVRVQPLYPARPLAQGIEGYVTVGFDVSEAGTVINVVVLESSHAMFEKAAINAAYRFRFKPRVIDGVSVVSRGIVNRFRFEIEK